MNKIIPIVEARQIVREKLKAAGYTGLYCAGECGCALDELMPCETASFEDADEFVNGCEGGHVHNDPTNSAFFVISENREPPSAEEWVTHRARYWSEAKSRAA